MINWDENYDRIEYRDFKGTCYLVAIITCQIYFTCKIYKII